MTKLALFADGRALNTLVLGIGDWVRTGDGRIIEIVKWPSISDADKWEAQEVRQANGNTWKVPA